MSSRVAFPLRRHEAADDPACGADEAIDGEANDRDLHETDQCPKEHDGKVAVSNFPEAQRGRVVRDERNTDSPGDQRGDKPKPMKAAA